jgi:hypothetical protein
MHTYDKVFFDYIEVGSIRSSKSVIPSLLELVNIGSVLDVGCGRGAWLKTWKEAGITECKGVDGEYIDRSDLLVEQPEFESLDISRKFDLGNNYELVQCLEVAEHIDESCADTLIENLCRHSNMVLFSAAPPGQGGEFHVNEKSYDYWRLKFSKLGYDVYDPLRKKLKDNSAVLEWYKYNIFLYIKKGEDNISSELEKTKVDAEVSLEDISPVGYKLRKKLVSFLPVIMSTWLAVVKKHVICFSLKFKS